ncbi:MAG: hypothetical protein CMP70_02915 [Flavobacteriales bacterium]|nr:hypothetical protein [Flavobacteriales bacterium]
MKKLLILLLVGFLSNTIVAQNTSEKNKNAKVEQTVKKCSDDKAKKCCSKDAKAEIKSEAKSCSSAKKSCCSKDKVKESTSKKCSKGDACCSKTGKKVADCDKKKTRML